MRMRLFAFPVLLLAQPLSAAEVNVQPQLEKHGSATQLIVDGKPFLILGAELHNSSSSSLDYMAAIWPRLAATPLNAVLTPLSWELVRKQGLWLAIRMAASRTSSVEDEWHEDEWHIELI